MTTLPSPGNKYWDKTDSLFYNYINSGGGDKIKQQTPIGLYEEGGYRMLDIRTKNAAVKTGWLK